MDDELFRRAKIFAASRGIPLKEVVERGVRLALDKPEPARKRVRVKFPLFPKKGRGKLTIPDDIAYQAQLRDDWERYEASL